MWPSDICTDTYYSTANTLWAYVCQTVGQISNWYKLLLLFISVELLFFCPNCVFVLGLMYGRKSPLAQAPLLVRQPEGPGCAPQPVCQLCAKTRAKPALLFMLRTCIRKDTQACGMKNRCSTLALSLDWVVVGAKNMSALPVQSSYQSLGA